MTSDNAIIRHIASAVRDMRADAGMSLRELEVRSGVPRSTICDLEGGVSMPSLATIYRLGAALHCSVFDLLPSMAEAQETT